MSTTLSNPPSTTPPPPGVPAGTIDQPSFGLSNIWMHPGSTWSALAAIFGVVGGVMTTIGLPTTPTGWVLFLGALASGIGGVLGK